MNPLALNWIEDDEPFPPVESALRDPDGLLCAGGDLSLPRLLDAYAQGIFPWFNAGEPPLWWSPDPRMVFRTDDVRLSSKFRRQLRRSSWTIRADTCFREVMQACALTPRNGDHGDSGTWISEEFIESYCALHAAGHAHSIEVMEGDMLAGGIYGVAIGQMFFGESMVSLQSGGSKVAVAALAHTLRGRGWPLIDAQVENSHLLFLGAERMPRHEFMQELGRLRQLPGHVGSWQAVVGEWPAAQLARDPMA